jgi:hypothetical protein
VGSYTHKSHIPHLQHPFEAAAVNSLKPQYAPSHTYTHTILLHRQNQGPRGEPRRGAAESIPNCQPRVLGHATCDQPARACLNSPGLGTGRRADLFSDWAAWHETRMHSVLRSGFRSHCTTPHKHTRGPRGLADRKKGGRNASRSRALPRVAGGVLRCQCETRSRAWDSRLARERCGLCR